MMSSTPALGFVGARDGDWWGHMSGSPGGWMWVWGFVMVLTWVAAFGVIVWLIARSLGRPTSSRAREILDERFARGELTAEEYRDRIDTLG
jgi:putative membrane protein